jgi:hypothetical protein
MQFTDQADFAALKSYHVAQWIDNNEAASHHPVGASLTAIAMPTNTWLNICFPVHRAGEPD